MPHPYCMGISGNSSVFDFIKNDLNPHYRVKECYQILSTVVLRMCIILYYVHCAVEPLQGRIDHHNPPSSYPCPYI